MSKEVQQKMFTLFFSTKALGKGTGLGVHISAKAIQQHGGEIEVDSDSFFREEELGGESKDENQSKRLI